MDEQDFRVDKSPGSALPRQRQRIGEVFDIDQAIEELSVVVREGFR